MDDIVAYTSGHIFVTFLTIIHMDIAQITFEVVGKLIFAFALGFVGGLGGLIAKKVFFKDENK